MYISSQSSIHLFCLAASGVRQLLDPAGSRLQTTCFGFGLQMMQKGLSAAHRKAFRPQALQVSRLGTLSSALAARSVWLPTGRFLLISIQTSQACMQEFKAFHGKRSICKAIHLQ